MDWLLAVTVNAVLAVTLVLGLVWGIAGSAVATAAAEWVQAIAYTLVVVGVARRHGVALRERNELLALLAPMKRDIVER